MREGQEDVQREPSHRRRGVEGLRDAHEGNIAPIKNLDQFGVRFPDMSEPYDMGLVEKALEITQKSGIRAISGVYVAVQGPNLETKAEYKFLRTIGADAVGMSTVPEVIVARHMNLPVFAVSAITDLCSPGKVKKVSLAEVLAGAAKAEPGMSKLIFELIKGL